MSEDLPKLVRDRIPKIIKEDGDTPIWSQVSNSQSEKLLKEKLVEEAQEFKEEGEIGELADLYAVMREYMDRKDITISDLEEIEADKSKERGGFKENILLKEVKSSESKDKYE